MKKMRLIDANALKTSFEEDGHLSSYIEEFIDNEPTIDVVPVVRCKDCKWRFSSNCPMFHEELTYNEDDGYEWIDRDHTSDDGFCEQGERMDGEEGCE